MYPSTSRLRRECKIYPGENIKFVLSRDLKSSWCLGDEIEAGGEARRHAIINRLFASLTLSFLRATPFFSNFSAKFYFSPKNRTLIVVKNEERKRKKVKVKTF